jgi:hypothetical protein
MSPEQIRAIIDQALNENRVELMTIHEHDACQMRNLVQATADELLTVERSAAMTVNAETWRRILAIALHGVYLSELRASTLRARAQGVSPAEGR